MSSSRLTTWACTDTSRADTGSSQMMMLGLRARARATPIRCRCPPENWWVSVDVIGVEPDQLQQLANPVSHLVLGSRPLVIAQGSATMSPTVILGLSEAYGSWKMIWM